MSKAYALQLCLKTACEFHVLAYGSDFTKNIVKEILKIEEKPDCIESEGEAKNLDNIEYDHHESDNPQSTGCSASSCTEKGALEESQKNRKTQILVKREYSFSSPAWADLPSETESEE